ncbi:hypothetical protein Pint_17091 [Pistacia integerrima]|uniref:Uncharacterized protein n=1 Tax=Pistacia integerrima TaxID=434235 RepID=A0ACC0ZBE1_9ROSI|nr:hypothetical protein Pint_17091 [Pistacia integerrima]
MSASSSPRSNSSQATLDASLLNRIQNGPPLTQPVPPPNAGNTTVLVTNLLFGYDLLGFVDGSRPCPPPTDPEYRLWLRQDRLVLLGIQATVNSAIGPTINNCSTSADAWDKLQASYENRSNTRMLTLLTTLMTTTKEGISVSEYMMKIKSVIDDLALIGHPMSDEEIIGHTLNGLQDEFKELTAAVRVRDSPVRFEDLYDKLLDEELIQKRGEIKKTDTPVTAQFTQRRSWNKNKGGFTHNRNFFSNNRSPQGSPSQQHLNSNPGYSRSLPYQGTGCNSGGLFSTI